MQFNFFYFEIEKNELDKEIFKNKNILKYNTKQSKKIT